MLDLHLYLHFQKTRIMKDSIIYCSDFASPVQVKFKIELPQSLPGSYSRPTEPSLCISQSSLHSQWSTSNEYLPTLNPRRPMLQLEWPSSLNWKTDTLGSHNENTVNFSEKDKCLMSCLFSLSFVFVVCLNYPLLFQNWSHVIFCEEGIRNLYLLSEIHKLKLPSKILFMWVSKSYS